MASGGVNNVIADTSYGVPVAGIDRCFDSDGEFDVGADGCVLDPGSGVSARIDQRAVQPSGGQATTTATITGPPGIEFVTKVGRAGVQCTDANGYGGPQTLADTVVVDVTVTDVDGMYLFCVAEPGREQFAATSIIQVDSTAPVVEPELSIVDGGDEVLVEPIFAVPELSDFRLKVGAEAVTDCADDDGYVRDRRIPVQVSVSDLPVAVCVIGSDEAGNEAGAYREVIEADTDAIEVSGVVRYLERIAMPQGAIVTVRIEDVSLADAPATTVAEQLIEPTHQVPIPFDLSLAPERFDERHRYVLRAQITVDGELWWTSDTAIPVSMSESTTGLDIVLVRAS